MPFSSIARACVEIVALRKIPKTMRAIWFLRYTSRSLVPELLSTRLASKILARRLNTQPTKTLAMLVRAEEFTRTLHALHHGKWELHLVGIELRSLNLDGSHSSLLERAKFSRSSLVDVRLFGSLYRSDFTRASLRQVSLIGFDLDRSFLRGAKLEDVVAVSGSAAWCVFDGAQISHCTFSEVRFESSSFSGVSMQEVVFECCDFENAVLDDTDFENVDFVECRNLDIRTIGGEGTNVISADATRATPGPRRNALGATPRGLGRLAGIENVPSSVGVRYARAGVRSRPPIGYRLQTLFRDVNLWIALGARYQDVRERLQREQIDFAPDALPKSRIRSLAQTLLGKDPRTQDPTLTGWQYRMLVAALRDRHPSLREVVFPELVLVDGSYPVANYVDYGDQRYIVVSEGLDVMAIRLARYCIAWLMPPAISYMDRWPKKGGITAARAALVDGLAEFASSGGNIAGLGRVQISGLRDTQAGFLSMAFRSFLLGHELGHFLHSIDFVPCRDTPLAVETSADLQGALLLQGEWAPDGDRFLIESLQNLDPDTVRRSYRSVGLTMRLRGYETVSNPTGAELDPKSEAFKDGIDRFAHCDWHVAAVTAFILALGGSAGYHGSHDPLSRAETVVRQAFGDQAAHDLVEEMDRPESVLGMLREVFGSNSAAA